ncbi:MAG: DUF2255 family protein [Streptosporangiaceae bacterium]|uniref:DUF2255 family protein n=1 Tax=Mycobacterium sp. TaxID=1785 RepID=UPI003F9613CA
MSTWSQEDLGLLGGAGEVEVSSVRRDGSLSRARTVWIVRVGDELYLRSVNGPDAAWYRSTRSRHQGRIEARGVARDVTWIDVDATGQPAVEPAVDAEYARKYRGSTSAIAHITSPLARTTTMRADPR